MTKAIDKLDNDLVALIAQRYELMKENFEIKDTKKNILNMSSSINDKKKLAKNHGIPSELVEDIYISIIGCFYVNQIKRIK